MIAKSDASSIFRDTRGSGSIEISVPGAFTAVGFFRPKKKTGASAAKRGRLSLFKTIDEDRRARHDHINRSGRSTYPGRISVQTSGATPELKHDFLWRTTCRLPERGRIGIFNRSYYEEVLITRVHPEILDTQNLPKHARDEKHFWNDRYRSIVDLEAHLHRNGTQIIKFFLHLSKKEQKKRFLERIEEPNKNWKFSSSDIHERKYWKDYMKAYEHCLAQTSTHHAPWYSVPADDKENARLIVSQILMDALDELKMAYPRSTPKRRRELQAIGKQLAKSQ